MINYSNPLFFNFPFPYLQCIMLRRMTGKLTNLTHSKDLPPSQLEQQQPQQQPVLPQVQIVNVRGSISTERTSTSDASKRGDSFDAAESSRSSYARTVHRPKGTYCLTDFIIQRTLGTGSFGRVHLGSLFNDISVHHHFSLRS